jgi:hypothetical protein
MLETLPLRSAHESVFVVLVGLDFANLTHQFENVFPLQVAWEFAGKQAVEECLVIMAQF